MLAKRVHALGAYPLAHLFAELQSGANPDEALKRYADLPADFIAALGGDEVPAPRIIKGRS